MLELIDMFVSFGRLHTLSQDIYAAQFLQLIPQDAKYVHSIV